MLQLRTGGPARTFAMKHLISVCNCPRRLFIRHSVSAIALALAVVLGIFPLSSNTAFAASTLKSRVLSIELPVASTWDYMDGTADYVGKHHSSIRPLVEAGANLYKALEKLQ